MVVVQQEMFFPVVDWFSERAVKGVEERGGGYILHLSTCLTLWSNHSSGVCGEERRLKFGQLKSMGELWAIMSTWLLHISLAKVIHMATPTLEEGGKSNPGMCQMGEEHSIYEQTKWLLQ